ncbi:MAG: septation protein IspZ [Pseudomonadota bacterium]|nr:septation protein IspZ [Pseudomonadota bacterium]
MAGTANIVVAYSFEEAVWVNFKLFGLIGLTLACLILQAVWITQRLPDQEVEPEQKKQ